MAWQPTTIRRFVRGFPSSARTALVETDDGLGYLKALGGPEGPHTLAAELVGTQLAAWFGLPTLEHAIIAVDEIDEIPFVGEDGNPDGQAQPGPAFITRRQTGEPWSGNRKQLQKLANPDDLSRLVVFDTWTLNCDRYSVRSSPPGKRRVNRNNVFLSEEAPAGQFLLKAIDHTHCFSCGSEWTKTLGNIGTIRDGRLFGLFPEFRRFLARDPVRQAVADLREIDKETVKPIVQRIPKEWDVSDKAFDALIELIVQRAGHVADTVESLIWPQSDLPFSDEVSTEPES